jgi:class 3 adenylate cyclase/tetratricopeptide (TPR) repeat protein
VVLSVRRPYARPAMVTCASCGEANPERARFCLSCGSALQAASAGEERKVVTVLFCDLVGFTASSDGADPEDVRARIRPYHARLRQEIERYGGTVEKFIGDAVMAVFGAPVAHEDDPERAVRAGLRILEAISDLNDSDPALGLQVRVGIETGEAVMAMGARPERGEGIVTGDVVNTASRLQGAAPLNGVVVGSSTHAATGEVFDYRELEPVVLKGKAESVPLWLAVAARARFGTDVTRHLTTPLVGRQIDLGILTGAFQKSLHEESVQLVIVAGEPGVGKSRLVAELFAQVDRQPDLLIRWRQGRCLPYGDAVAFWALGEIVKAEAGILESDSPAAAASKIDAVVAQERPDAQWLRQRLRPLVGLDAPEAAPEENFAAWRAFLEHLAEQRPSVFVFEDLHWADQTLLAFLEHLAEYAQGVPMLLLGTARPELFEKAPGFGQSAPNSHRINLAPLTDVETAKLVSNLLQQALPPAEVQEAIVSRSGGNPLYAEEFIRLLKDRRILTRRGLTWSIDPQAEIPLPIGIHALISARLDTLSADRKRLLQDAAVIGKVFWSGAVAEMGGMDGREVEHALHELSRKELVRPARSSSIDHQAEYAFHHALVRDVCHAQIPRARRAERHQRAAAWIEKVSGERVADHADILAYHYTEALALARAAGLAELARDLEGPARRFLLLAGDRAIGLETAKALQHYSRALELAPHGDPERPAILVRWGDAARQAGQQTEAVDALRAAVTGFEDLDDGLGAARAMVLLSQTLVYSGDARGHELLEDAVERLERESSGPDLVTGYSSAAGMCMRRGAYQAAIRWADRAIALAAELGLEEPVRALSARGTSRCCLGDPEGLQEERRALAAAIDRGLGREAAVLYNNMAVDLASISGPQDALRTLEEGIAFAESRGIDEWAMWMKTGLLNNRLAVGAWDRIEADAVPLAARLESGGMVIPLIWVRMAVARMFLLRGERQKAEPLIEWALETARTAGGADERPAAFTLAALASLGRGQPDRARDLLNELDRMGLHANDNYVATLPELVHTALAAGDPGLAERLTVGAQPLFPLHENALLSVQALLTESRGSAKEAAELFARAADRWGEFGDVWERAQALLNRGRCLLAGGDPHAAARVLAEARAIFVHLGARPAAASTDPLLERAMAASS